MKRPTLTARASDDTTVLAETGRSRAEWFRLIEKEAGQGRAAVNKVLVAKKVDSWWVATLAVEYEAHAGLVDKDGRPKGYSICATKSVAVPAARAFKAFTTARDLDEWFGPRTSISASEGGSLENGDGNSCTFRKVRPDKTLAYSWNTPGFAEGSEVEVLFQPKGEGCGLVVNHTRVLKRHEADELRALWGTALTQLKSHLEG